MLDCLQVICCCWCLFVLNCMCTVMGVQDCKWVAKQVAWSISTNVNAITYRLYTLYGGGWFRGNRDEVDIAHSR